MIAALVRLYGEQLPYSTTTRGRPPTPETVRGYVTHLRIFAGWCGNRSALDLTPALVQSYLASLWQAGQTPQTVASREKVVRLFCGWLVTRGVLERDPCAGLARTHAPDPEVAALTDAEIRAALDACDRQTWAGTRDFAVIMTLWRTGLRASELCALTLADYDGGAGEVVVRKGKGGRRRLVGMADDARLAVDDWLLIERGTAEGPLFPSERGHAMGAGSLAQMLQRVSARAGVRLHAHAFRHRFAVDCLEAGLDIYLLSRLLGHSTIAMSARYLRTFQQGRAVEAQRAAFRRVR